MYKILNLQKITIFFFLIRIFQALLTTTSPRKAQLKTFTANSPAVYYEAVIGFKNQDHFIAGLYDHEANGEKTLADFNVQLDNNRILSMKTHWEKENFKNVWVSLFTFVYIYVSIFIYIFYTDQGSSSS